ncbi:hypothetical protein N658DRAFT_432956, partial [Parathielavia hyrcaniae]
HFLVSSKALSLASRVFAAMFGPNFNEGQRLRDGHSSGVPSAFSLPEDDPKAMDFVLSFLHYQYYRLTNMLSAEEIVNIAILSDKYDLNNALGLWIKAGFDDQPFPVDTIGTKLRDMGYGILAAFLFRSPKQLEPMTAEFIKDMPPDFAETWAKYELLGRMPEEILNHLTYQIKRALARLRYHVFKTVEALRKERIAAPNAHEAAISCSTSAQGMANPIPWFPAPSSSRTPSITLGFGRTRIHLGC